MKALLAVVAKIACEKIDGIRLHVNQDGRQLPAVLNWARVYTLLKSTGRDAILFSKNLFLERLTKLATQRKP
jgi:hypothetical protein